MKIRGKDTAGYTYLGDFSATPPWYSVSLSCDRCMVTWVGCFDAMHCPKCDDASDFAERFMGDPLEHGEKP